MCRCRLLACDQVGPIPFELRSRTFDLDVPSFERGTLLVVLFIPPCRSLRMPVCRFLMPLRCVPVSRDLVVHPVAS